MNIPTPATFMTRAAAWLVDVSLCAIPAMFVAWAMVRVPATALVDAAPVSGSMLEMEQHLVQYLEMHLMASLWFLGSLVALYAVLSIVFEAGLNQATPGKRLMHLQVEDPLGRAPTPRQAAARFAAGGLSWLSLNIGHAMVLWRKDKKALHDIISGLRVVDEASPAQANTRTSIIVLVLVLAIVFWTLLPGPVPSSPVVEHLLQEGLSMVMAHQPRY